MIEEVREYRDAMKKYNSKKRLKVFVLIAIACFIIQMLFVFSSSYLIYPYKKMIIGTVTNVDTKSVIRSVVIGQRGETEDGERMYTQNIILEYDNHGSKEKVHISNHEVNNPNLIFKEGQKRFVLLYSMNEYSYKIYEYSGIIVLIPLLILLEIVIIIRTIRIPKPIKPPSLNEETAERARYEEIREMNDRVFKATFGYSKEDIVNQYRNLSEEELENKYGVLRKPMEDFVNWIEKEQNKIEVESDDKEK